MRGLRVGGVVVGLVLLCLSAVVGVVGGSRLSRVQLDQAVTAGALENASSIEEYFARSSTINLLLANTPAFRERFGGAHDGHGFGASEETHRIEAVLAYLEHIYRGQIGEACVIDRNGVEVARVVAGDAANDHELSHDEAENDFFRATLALRPGQVHQARPYVSPDTGEWVIATATPIPAVDGGRPRAIAHFEVTLDSFRRRAEHHHASGYDVLIVDRSTGRILAETGRPQRVGERLGRTATPLTRAVVATGRDRGMVNVDGRRAAYRAVRTTTGNENSWVVVAAAPDTAAPWSTGPGKGAIAAAIGALVLLGSSVVGFRANQRQLRHRASTDPLTGLANRTVLHRRLETVLAHADQHSTAALLLLDLDGFKEVNDTLGHSQGDVLLREVAGRVREQLRHGDLASRLGGDEFALLVENLDGLRGVTSTVSRLLAAIRQPFHLEGVGVHVDASVGVVLIPEHGHTPELLVQRADVAMYQAKRAKAGHVLYAPENDLHSASRLSLTAGLLEAIEQRQIGVHYQPKVDMRTGKVVGVEALVRWTHPTLGPLAPTEFIPIAEKTGLIRPLTECVLDTALAQLRVWREDGHELQVAVNCSAVDLVDDRFVDEVAAALARHGVPAGWLQLEITETAIMSDPTRAGRVLHRLDAMGVRLSVDDYGTGYSSLTYLKRLPVSELKIDREFVAHVDSSSADAMIVRSTIELGHSLGLQVVAEGVESASALDYLAGTDCDTAQGYHLSRPMSAGAMTRWLTGESVSDGVPTG